MDFYLIVEVDRERRKVFVRAVDGGEFWSWPWCFEAMVTQGEAEALGARWRLPPQERPGLVGSPRHPSHPAVGGKPRKE